MKLSLNLTQQPDDSGERVAEAAKRKKAATETMDDAWQRILSLKNSEADQARLLEVKAAMQAGTIGRSPADAAKRFSKAEVLRLHKQLAEQQREDTLRRMVEETPANYELITTERQFQSLLSALSNEPIIAVDTETTGVDVYTDIIVGLSISLPKADRHIYIPVDHVDCAQLERDYVLEGLAPVFNDESVGKVLHNAIFDIAMFRRHGYDLKGVRWDTMTAMHLLNENEESFKLKDLAPKYLGVASDTFDALFGKNAQFREVPLDIALVYAAKDTHLTWKLYEFQRAHMAKMPTILQYYQTVEVPLLYVIVDLEANGYVLDLDFAKEYGEQLHKRAEELSAELIATLTPFHDGDDPINLNSTQQMKPALSKAIGKELPNMDAKKTLKPLKGEHDVIAKLLEYKNITKLSSTYIDALPLKQNPTTKRWHSRFNPMGTVTGRFSSGKDEDNNGQFNVQNQPQEARPMFVAPTGKVLVGADFKAQEIRCVAYLSGEPVLINAFLEERDPYAMMASNFYKRPYEEVYKNADGSDTKERKQMKVVWLATLYGMSKYSLAEMLGVDVKAAVQFQSDLFESMPNLNAWIEGNKKFVERNGFVWTDKEARKRRLPDAKIKLKGWGDQNFGKKNRALRQATNARVQGSSSIQTKVTMIRAHEYCAKKPGWSLWCSVHDELIFEVPEDFTQEEAQDIRDIMLNSYTWGNLVPNGTDVEVMRRWGHGQSLEEWFDKK
ncbi:DNA polymerase [Heyndrickxia sporothermodurans]|uniref:DNA polymerase n=1 Tax=Heyndrickxia sporothermodurans TaxID=46224 RepID=UPI002E25150F|nr:DNA polymerase [Heyndrickxia sporothermodurans]MED3649985.1 DNA polymerase [Heyndrickxia sporothermodurans]MED3697971.1 DNA polymerase [Heyndrickxia sporothermodurans]